MVILLCSFLYGDRQKTKNAYANAENGRHNSRVFLDFFSSPPTKSTGYLAIEIFESWRKTDFLITSEQ